MKSALPAIFIHTTQLVGVTVQVLATLPAVQLEKFLVMNVLLLPVIVKLASVCTQSELLPNISSLNAFASINQVASLPEALSNGILFSSPAQADVLAVFTGLTNNLAPVAQVAVCAPCSARVASSTTHCTVVLAFTGVRITAQYVVLVGILPVLARIHI